MEIGKFADFGGAVQFHKPGFICAPFILGRLSKQGLDAFLTTVRSNTDMMLVQDLVYYPTEDEDQFIDVANYLDQEKFYKIRRLEYYEQQFQLKDLHILARTSIVCMCPVSPSLKVHCQTWLLVSNKDAELCNKLSDMAKK